MLNILIANLDIIISVGIAAIAGILFRISLSLVGQRWVRTYHHSLTFILLPIITLVITKVISGNLTLSIGMVGALSIVRFRNPVKNPFELSILFALLTIGIASGVNIKWALVLTFLVLLAIFGAYFMEKLYSMGHKSLFALSFDEGMPVNLVEASSSKSIESLRNSSSLQHIQVDKQSALYNYRLAYRTRAETNKIVATLEKLPEIDNISVQYSRDVL